jgi:hypothetical protein
MAKGPDFGLKFKMSSKTLASMTLEYLSFYRSSKETGTLALA